MDNRTKIVMALTKWDRKHANRKGHNPYFLGIALGQLDDADIINNPQEFILENYEGRLADFLIKEVI